MPAGEGNAQADPRRQEVEQAFGTGSSAAKTK